MLIKLVIYAVTGFFIWRTVAFWLKKLGVRRDPSEGGHDNRGHDDKVTEMVACPVCQTFVIAHDKTGCGRPNCPRRG